MCRKALWVNSTVMRTLCHIHNKSHRYTSHLINNNNTLFTIDVQRIWTGYYLLNRLKLENTFFHKYAYNIGYSTYTLSTLAQAYTYLWHTFASMIFIKAPVSYYNDSGKRSLINTSNEQTASNESALDNEDNDEVRWW